MLGRSPPKGGLTLDDAAASRAHAELVYMPEYGCVRVVDQNSKNGTFVDGHRIKDKVLGSNAVLRIGSSLFVYEEGAADVDVNDATRALSRAHLEARADKAAAETLPILILGPTGAGKERLAQRVHASSGRSGAWVAFNCATLSGQLLGSELFGHKKGAFSGATADRTGLIASADGGTLFLDEIADLPLDQQPALLRVLQEGRVRPVGSDAEVQVDVRIVSATHIDLEGRTADGAFRSDLLGRLAGLELRLGGLAERRVEILSLLDRFAPGLRLAPQTAECLLTYDWPRNVRELEHLAVQLRLFAASAGEVGLDQLPERFRTRPAAEASGGSPATPAAGEPPSSAAVRPDRARLLALLETHDGRVARVARALDLSRQSVYRLFEEYGIDPAAVRRQLQSSGSD